MTRSPECIQSSLSSYIELGLRRSEAITRVSPEPYPAIAQYHQIPKLWEARTESVNTLYIEMKDAY